MLVTAGCLLFTWGLVFAAGRAMLRPAKNDGSEATDGPVMNVMMWTAVAIPALLVMAMSVLFALSITGVLDSMLE